MNKILITGFSGFVSKYFIEYLEENKIESTVLGIDLSKSNITEDKFKYVRIYFKQIDIFDKENVEKVICDFKPDYLLHLASFSSVAFSWKNPVESFQNNTNIFLNIAEAIRQNNLSTRILSIGSSEEYGNLGQEYIPLKEDYLTRPINPYAVARLSQEMISKVFVSGFNMNIIMTRSFNHIGPRQNKVFVISSFARQLCQIKLDGGKGIIETGDVSIIRDFLDVRDVVDAYFKLLMYGEVGEVYNVCSGKGITLEEIIRKMANILEIEVEIRVNKKLIRPADNKIIIGSPEKLKQKINWELKYSIDNSLKDIINYWMQYLKE
jgi:GDP-4-dehydro-6-deoxy-D-mannose reductase